MRVVYVLAEYSLHNHIVESHRLARPGDHIAICKVPLVLRGKSRSETVHRIVPKLSQRFLAGKVLEGLAILAITALPKLMGRGPVFRRLRTIARRHHLPFHRTEDIMSKETLEFIREQQPDLVVTLFHQIVRQAFETWQENNPALHFIDVTDRCTTEEAWLPIPNMLCAGSAECVELLDTEGRAGPGSGLARSGGSCWRSRCWDGCRRRPQWSSCQPG